MTAAQAAVVNESLIAIGNQVQITDLGDGTPAGNAAAVIYTPLVHMLMRQIDPDFARTTVALVPLSPTIVAAPYAFEYTYPPDCLRTRQVRPPLSGSGALADPLDPQPVRWAVAFDNTLKVILTNQANALLVYTSFDPVETLWDASFREVVVDWLGGPLSMAIAGRPDFAKNILEKAAQMAQMSEGHDDGG